MNLRNHQIHSMSEDKDRKLATNRLLDILRSQQTKDSVEDDKSIKVEKTVIDDKEENNDIVDDQSIEEKKATSDSETVRLEEDISSEIKEEPSKKDEKSEDDPDSIIPETSKKKEISASDLLSTLKNVQSGPSVSEEKKASTETKTEPLVDESFTPKVKVQESKSTEPSNILEQIKKPKEKSKPFTDEPKPTVDKPKPSMDEPGPLADESKPLMEKPVSPEANVQESKGTAPTNLLEQIQKPAEKPEPKELNEVFPKEFDSSLLSTLSDQKKKRTIQDYLESLFHLFNESSRRITIHHGEKSIRLLQIKTGFKHTEIEKVKEYVLPYTTEEGQIEDSNDLLRFIFSHEIDSKEVKYAYGAYFSPNVETKTHILQAPPLSKKELSDLVEWDAKKNIPFSPDQAIIDYENSHEVVDKGDKHNIVIGISDEENIEEAIGYFSKSKLKPRLISTLPVLMWKLFLLNYPERKNGCFLLVHLDENNTTISLIKDQQLLMTREILFGAEDFYQAAMQKVVTEDQTLKIDYPLAQQLLTDYGIPDDTIGVTLDSHISLYKLSIFLRPALERLTGELNRSMKYFTKQIPDLEWTEMLFDGKCATFPNLVNELGNNLFVKVGLLNPMRKGLFHFKDDGMLSSNQMPLYTINFALASEKAEKINVIPKKLRSNFKYLLLYKVAAVVSALALPIYLVSSILSGFNIKHLEKEIQTRSTAWDNLSIQAKEYIGLMTDIDILNGYRSFLENDRKHSVNQIKILKLFSTIVPNDIKLTMINFIKVSVESDANKDDTGNGVFKPGLEVNGFVEAEASISDIHLTNFVMKLEHLNIFSKIDLSVDKTSKTTEGKLFFSLNMRL